jgi:hypothetical protein
MSVPPERAFHDISILLQNHPHELHHYVETGCRRGGLIAKFAEADWNVIGVELDPLAAMDAANAVRTAELGGKGQIVVGDSARVLWHVCQELKAPALFFLDAHWWAGYDDCAEGDLPLLSELAAIRTRPYADFIVIDDAQLLGIKRSRCKKRGVDLGWFGATRDAVYTAVGRKRMHSCGFNRTTEPIRMWISMQEDPECSRDIVYL